MRVKAGDPKVAIAYMRVSTTEQHLGLEAQQYAVEQWAKANGVLLAATFVDRLSGGTGLDREGTALDLSRRPALMDAVEALTGAGAGLLLLAKRDRLARDVVLAGLLDRVTAAKGARIVSADGVGVDDSPAGRFQKQILDAVAEYERAIIRARTVAALAAKRRRGEKTGGQAPYGWGFRLGSTDAKILVPDEAEQAVIATILALRDRGLSVRKLAGHLNESGVPCRGARWHPNTVQRVLRQSQLAVSPPPA